MRRFTIAFALVVIALGIGSGLLSRVWDSGFVHGLFQGAALVLLVLGAYLIGKAVWGADSTGMWRPSKGEPRREH